MTYLSIEKNKFCAGDDCFGRFGVYTCVRHLLNISDQISDDQMHQQVVTYYFENKNYKTYGWCEDEKRQALAVLYDIIICLVCQGQDDTNQSIVTIKFYGKKPSLRKKFVYIHCNETTFKFRPLHITNKENSTEKITMIDHYDMAKNLLRIYITDDLKYVGDIKLDYDDNIDVDKAVTSTNDPNKIKISNSILINQPQKRKESERGNIAMTPNNVKQLPIEISDEYYVPNKRTKIGEGADSRMSTFYEKNSETKTIQGRIQVQDIRDESDPLLNQQQMEDLSMALNNEHQEEKVKGEDEPNSKLENDAQDNDKVNYNSESSEAKPIS